MKILVTGAAGFIGFHTAKQLLESGYDVIGVDNLNNFYDINDEIRLSSVLYWSGGAGGGTGTYGSSFRKPAVDGQKWYRSSPWGWDWDAAIATNSDRVDANFHATENRS